MTDPRSTPSIPVAPEAIEQAYRRGQNDAATRIVNEAASIAGVHPIQRVDIISIESLRAIAQPHKTDCPLIAEGIEHEGFCPTDPRWRMRRLPVAPAKDGPPR